MGLDMYLNAKKFLYSEKEEAKEIGEMMGHW